MYGRRGQDDGRRPRRFQRRVLRLELADARLERRLPRGLLRVVGRPGLLRLDLDLGRVRRPLGLGLVGERLPHLRQDLLDELLLLLAREACLVVLLDGRLGVRAVLLVEVGLAGHLLEDRRRDDGDGRAETERGALERVAVALRDAVRDDRVQDLPRPAPLRVRDRALLEPLDLLRLDLDLVLGRGRGPLRLRRLVQRLPPRAQDRHDLLVLLQNAQGLVPRVRLDRRLDLGPLLLAVMHVARHLLHLLRPLPRPAVRRRIRRLVLLLVVGVVAGVGPGALGARRHATDGLVVPDDDLHLSDASREI